MLTLFEQSQKRDEWDMKFQVKLHGGELVNEEKSTFIDPETKTKVEADTVLFKDPSAYAHMTQEQKEEETQKLMKFTERWAGTKPLGGKAKKRI